MSELLDHNSILHFFHEGEIALRADHILAYFCTVYNEQKLLIMYITDTDTLAKLPQGMTEKELFLNFQKRHALTAYQNQIRRAQRNV